MIPLYTLGPGKKGQRYSPKMGPNALYVAEDVVTAQAEYHRVLRVVLVTDPTYHVITNPTVQLTIQVNLERVLDLTDTNVLAALGTTIDELTGPWRKQKDVLSNTCTRKCSLRQWHHSSHAVSVCTRTRLFKSDHLGRACPAAIFRTGARHNWNTVSSNST